MICLKIKSVFYVLYDIKELQRKTVDNIEFALALFRCHRKNRKTEIYKH